MRGCFKDMQTFWYSRYGGRKPIYDDDGHETGDYDITRCKPVKCRGNISAARGDVIFRQFGEDTQYDRVLSLCDVNTPIDEHTVLWVGRKPAMYPDGNLVRNADDSYPVPWNYIVTKVGRSINSVSIALSEVDVK